MLLHYIWIQMTDVSEWIEQGVEWNRIPGIVHVIQSHDFTINS